MLLHAPLLLAEPEVRINHAVRRFRWFRRAFLEQLSTLTQATGHAYHVDTARLAAGFFAWSAAFDRDKPSAAHDKRRFVDYISGVMLHHLLQAAPLAAVDAVKGPDTTSPAAYWPEGFAYVTFCLNVRAAVLTQDFGENTLATPQLDNLRDWWSFRENFAETPVAAIGFFQHFAGVEPDWNGLGAFERTAPPAQRSPAQLRIVTTETGTEANIENAPPSLALPENLSLAVFDLNVVSNSSALVEQALEQLLLRYGLPMAKGLATQPLAATLTHIGRATGRVCPSRSLQMFQTTLETHYKEALVLDPAARTCLAMLASAGVALRLAVEDDKALSPNLIAHLGLNDMALLTDGPAPLGGDTVIWVSSSPERLQNAAQQGYHAVAVGCKTAGIGQMIEGLDRFPLLPCKNKAAAAP